MKDLELLQRLHLGNDSDDDIPDHDDYIDTHYSDDETYDPANLDHDDYSNTCMSRTNLFIICHTMLFLKYV